MTMKKTILLLLASWSFCGLSAQENEITTAQAKSLYKATTKQRVSIHDPSVVWEPTAKRYYIFGSHRGMASSTNLQSWTGGSFKWKTATSSNATNAQAFVKPLVTTVPKGGTEVSLPAFDAQEWSSRTDANYNIDGNMWAPDVIWNPTMQKWCMYLSINGDAWHSSIILLTADKITGPYQYQGPVVICGFQDSGHSYKDTDLELVLGTQSALPSRYNVGSKWGSRWPHTIDPAAFFDEDGKLWLVYGSWSGGIWMLELNEENGLRDYDVTYPVTGSGDGVTSDPYFGTKVGGGFYVSGEGPYIEHIGKYYYLFVSYGFYSPDGGYEMRVFRSDKPNGPYKDPQGRSAIFTAYAMNYGTGNSDTRGEKLMGAYNGWGFMTVGECAQGHNSVIAADDGKTYLVCHTKFNDGTAGHQVRVHQLWQNKQGWLVASPFEYNGESLTDNDVATSEIVDEAEIPGTYQVLVHKYRMNYKEMEEVTPVKVTLTADGKVTGAYSGTWSREKGTSYLTIKLGSVTYNGVLVELLMDQRSIKTVSFSAMATSGVNVWGYKYRSDYSVAWHVNNQSVPVRNGQSVNKNVDLYSMGLDLDNVSLQWQSNSPDIISHYGKYYPLGLQQDTVVTLTARIASGNCFWQQTYAVKALSEANAATTVDWQKDMVARYAFDGDDALANSLDKDEKAQQLHNGTTSVPAIEQGDPLRNGGYIHMAFGANGKESYVSIPNPLKGKELESGATVSLFVKRTDNNLWDALFGFVDGSSRLFMTGNLYTGFNDGKTADEANGTYHNWLDINNPNTVTTTDLSAGHWHLLTVVFERKATSTTGGITVYVDATKHTGDKFEGSLSGTTVKTKQAFDYNLVVDHLAACNELFLGYGSFWGSADASIDEVIVYDRALSLSEVQALNQMVNRSDVEGKTEGIASPAQRPNATQPFVYDLAGRRIQPSTFNPQPSTLNPQPSTLKRGVYVKNGKIIIIK